MILPWNTSLEDNKSNTTKHGYDKTKIILIHDVINKLIRFDNLVAKKRKKKEVYY